VGSTPRQVKLPRGEWGMASLGQVSVADPLGQRLAAGVMVLAVSLLVAWALARIHTPSCVTLN